MRVLSLNYRPDKEFPVAFLYYGHGQQRLSVDVSEVSLFSVLHHIEANRKLHTVCSGTASYY